MNEENRYRFGLVGLGRMGSAVAHNALSRGHRVVGYNRTYEKAERLEPEGLEAVRSLEDLVEALDPPRIVLLYLPHGDVVGEHIDALGDLMDPKDILADTGNSDWRRSRERADLLDDRGIRFLDIGTSGGIEGAREGACFMAGGDRDAFEQVRPLLQDLAVDDDAVYYAGPPGAGHFVKLVHNAIEFGMIQAIAEGAELVEGSDYDVDLGSLFEHWNHGSVIRGWLVELMGRAFTETPDRSHLSSYVEDTGEVKWMIDWSLDKDIPLPVVSAAQTTLMQYRNRQSASATAVALLRNQFGEHPVLTKGVADPE